MKINKALVLFVVVVLVSGIGGAVVDSFIGFEHSSGFLTIAMHDLFQKFTGGALLAVILYGNHLAKAAEAKKAVEEALKMQPGSPS